MARFQGSKMLTGLFAIIACVAAGEASMGAAPLPGSEWDQSLLTMVLKNVRLEGGSLMETWNRMVQRFLLRCVLVSVNGDADVPRSFSFAAERCNALELLNAIVSTYPDVIWTQDNQYGVIWIHPQSLPYTRILEDRVRITSEELGTPMFDGVLESLAEASAGRIRPDPSISGPQWRNTYDYTVDLAAGTYTVRDIINLCCLADPTKTFYIGRRFGHVDRTVIYPLNLNTLAHRNDPLPKPGALQIWRLGVGPVGDEGPADDMVCRKMADGDPSVRASARNYASAEMFRIRLPDARGKLADPQIEAWVWLGRVENVVKLAGAKHPEAVARLRQLATDEALLTWPADLSLLVAMDLACLDQDTHALDVLLRREFKPGQLKGIRSRMFAVARMSKEAREKLAGGLARKLAVADPALAALPDVRPAPRAPELFQGPEMPLPPPRPPERMPAMIDFKFLDSAQTQPQP